MCSFDELLRNDYNVSSLRQTCDNRDNTEEGIVLALKWLIGGYRMGHKCKITGEKAVARPCSILLNESQWGKTEKKEKFINWYLLTLSLPHCQYGQLTLFLVVFTGLLGSSNSWLRCKSIIVPFSHGFRLELIIKSGSIPEETLKKNQARSMKNCICSGMHIYAVSDSLMSYHRKLKMSCHYLEIFAFVKKMIFLFLIMLLH